MIEPTVAPLLSVSHPPDDHIADGMAKILFTRKKCRYDERCIIDCVNPVVRTESLDKAD